MRSDSGKTVDDPAVAMERVNEACARILTNPIMEGYEFTLHET